MSPSEAAWALAKVHRFAPKKRRPFRLPGRTTEPHPVRVVYRTLAGLMSFTFNKPTWVALMMIMCFSERTFPPFPPCLGPHFDHPLRYGIAGLSATVVVTSGETLERPRIAMNISSSELD